MRLFGLIGYPLTHSFSKKYFTEKFEKAGRTDCRYENFPLLSIGELTSVLEKYPQLEGLNVTIPYKKSVLYYLSDASDEVKKTGACNCIRISGGKLLGYNTDVAGFRRSLKKYLLPHHEKALVLGTGGAARAVEYVLSQLNIAYTSVSRNPSSQSITYPHVDENLLGDHLLIINTTPLGMTPLEEELPDLPYHALRADHLLFDLIYNPDKTLFLQEGEKKGATTVNGYEMLILQAEESWKIWNDGSAS